MNLEVSVMKNKMTQLKKYDQISEVWIDYKNAIRNYIFKLVKDQELANELSHDVLMKVYSSCCSGRAIRNIRSWLFQIAYNTCMDYFKKNSRTTELKMDIADIEETLIYKDAVEYVKPLLKLLPPKYATPLELTDIKGLKQQQVANELGLSLTATKSRVQRGRKLLKNEIMNCFHVEVDQKGQLTAFDLKSSCDALKDYAIQERTSF